MKNSTLFLLAIMVIIGSCSENENAAVREVRIKGQTLTEIHIDNIPSEVVRMNLSALFTDFSIIPLETNDESLIGAYNKRVKITDDDIFFGFHGMDKPAILLRFDKGGNFLNRIGSGGRGPGEHGSSDVHAIIPDEENKRVTVEWFGLVNEGAKTYNYDGTFIESITNPMILLYGFYKWAEDEWFSCGSASGNIQYERDSLLVVFYNNNGEITGLIPRKVYPYPVSNGYTPGTGIVVHRHKGNYKIFSPESDTVYILSKEKLIPADVIHRGKDAMPYNKYVDPQSVTGKHDIKIVDETDNNYILTKRVVTRANIREYMPGIWGGSFEADNLLIVADKRRRTAAVIEFVDDVFGIIPEKSKYEFSLTNNLEDGRISYPIDAITFLKMAREAGVELKDLAKFSVSPERLLALTSDSNPVILTFTLKDNIRIE
jgi:hypothetical protein